MAEPKCEDEGLLQEWTPLTQLLQRIPLKSQRGIFSQNLNLTCLDVVSEFLALGTNSGFAYWYCRGTADLQKLRFENSNCSVTCVKIMAFSDYMVAVGTDQGTVIVFHIPKIEPDSTPDQIKSKQKQIERFTINNLHQSPVTSIEWDPNKMNVFSGDKLGCVVLTEINLNLHISKSMEILNEQFEVVQLNFNQHILLVSTVYRSIICDGSNNWKVRQVGTKERKILGKFGATLCKFEHGLMLYASRPGHRLWLSNHNGIVQQTLIFKSAIESNCPKIQLINPIDKKAPYDTSFGKVIQFRDKLITYNSEILYVLHVGAVSVVSVLNSARKILDLAVNETEIFILEGERSLLRISSFPDKYSLDLLYQPVSRRTSFNLDELAAKLKDTAVESIKKITKDLIPSNNETSPNSPPILADEAIELPLIVNLPPGIMPTILSGENIEIHSSVVDEHFLSLTKNLPSTCHNNVEKSTPFAEKGSNNFSPFNYDWQEEVVSRPLRKRQIKKSKQNLQCSTLVSEFESDTTSNISEDRLVCGIVNELSLSDESTFSHSQSSFSVLRDIPSLLGREKTLGNEDVKTYDTKSQASLDTCESVSERLLLTSDAFREEQEKTFARLANQSVIDSFNSENTDNMSISFNMTTSSSFSSKISENLPSSSYTSENSEVASRIKSVESQNTDNFDNEVQSLSKNCWKWDNNAAEEISNQEDHMKVSSESSGSNLNSQNEAQLYQKWAHEGEAGSSFDFPVNVPSNFQMAGNNSESDYCGPGSPERVFTNGASGGQNKISDCANETLGNDYEINSPVFSEPKNSPFSGSGNYEIEEEEKRENDFDAKTFLSNEGLSYGPPSGSSMLGSQPSSDFSSMHVFKALVCDSVDHWPEHKAPNKITSLDVCKNYVICTDIKDNVYYSHLSGLSLSWKLLDYKASMVRIAKDGSAVWFLYKKNMYALVNPPLSSPVSDDIVEIAQDIKTFGVDRLNNKGLLVTFTGKIKRFSGIKKGLHEKEIICDYVIADIICSDEMILAIRSDCTVLCKFSEEEEFKVIKTLKPVISIAVGPENLLWLVDKANNIFFSDDFLSDEPHWWQIQISDYIFQNSPRSLQNIRSKIKFNKLNADIKLKSSLIAVNEDSVWIFNKFDSFVYVNNKGFTGYIWTQISPVRPLTDIQWRTLCIGGVTEEKERIWLLSNDGNIFLITPNRQTLQSVPAPCEENILCLTSLADSLWILSENGKIYSRLGLSSSNLLGTAWKEIKLPQIDNLKFIWISCGYDVSWACDIHGRTFITIGPPHHLIAADPIWFEVEGRPRNVQFEKVFVGSRLNMVWAIDTNHYLYVREGIFPHYQIGTNWVYVCGIEAAHLLVSETHVLALTDKGNIYRRYGISESNFTGDYWRKIPGRLKILSSTFIDKPCGINHENKILRLNYNLKILQEEKINTGNKEAQYLRKDISWEIVK